MDDQFIKDAATRLWQLCTSIRSMGYNTAEEQEVLAQEIDKVAIQLAAGVGLTYDNFDFDETNNFTDVE